MSLDQLPETPAVLGIGWVFLDSLLLIPDYPQEDTKVEASRELEQLGGPVARALSVVSSFGVLSTISAVIGDDPSGLQCSQSLSARGILTDVLQVAPRGRTRRSQVWVALRNSSRTIAYSRGELPQLVEVSSLLTIAESARILHLDGREPQVALPVAARMHQLGKTVVVDAGDWKPGIESILDCTDILVVSSKTLRRLGGAGAVREAIRLRDMHGLQSVVVTDGSKGTSILEGLELRHVQVPAVKPLDTNGAGDAFTGGLIYGLLSKWSLMDCVRFGSGVAALGCRYFGDYFPTVDEVLSFLSVENPS